MKQFKIRCSAIGQIMTQPRTKKAQENGELSETSKTYCQNWIIEQKFNRRKEFSSKFTEKGIEVEDNSINFLFENTELPFMLKNEQFFENDFLTGTPDVILPEKVIDIKSSWDLFTFPYFESEINKMYFWQLQGYMILTGKKEAELIYVLQNTPTNLIEKEIFYATKDIEFLTQERYEEIANKIEKNHIFDDLNPKDRIKRYSIIKLDDAEEQIYSQVEKCRNYINSINN